MSNAIQYDPLLTAYLAAELQQRLQGLRCTAIPLLAPDRSVSVWFEGGMRLQADLHPTRGWVRLLEATGDEEIELDATCTGIEAPPDERLIRIRLHETGRFRSQLRTLILELHTNQWNALLLGEEGRITMALRARSAGGRRLHPGEAYAPPQARARIGATEVAREAARAAWRERIEEAAPESRRAALLTGFAWTGSINVDWILGDGTGAGDMEEAFERWWWLRGSPPARPGLLRTGPRIHPYPLRLAGMEWEAAGSLLEAMGLASEGEETRPEPQADSGLARAIAFAASRAAGVERKIARLEEELARAGEADRLRRLGDILLAHLHEVPRGADAVRLPDWEGGSVEIPLDPQLTPAQNATELYERARRKARAEERIPELLRAARAELTRWREASDRLAAGELPAWLAGEIERSTSSASRGRGAEQATLPYRLYRTSGGLEVRVGRGARENDRLTFRESSPNDVWLHARSVAGSHVILRWPDSEAAPPARDLSEAAQLAALHSRARTSGLVAVDWTRRKHVRKPRGAAPGLVLPQRVKTVFVEPDESVIERMRV